MLNKLKKFFADISAEVTEEYEDEEYRASYDATAGSLLRGEKKYLELDLSDFSCNDPIQKGVLDAVSGYEFLKERTEKQLKDAIVSQLAEATPRNIISAWASKKGG